MQSNRHHPLNYVGRCSVSSGNGSPTSRLKSSEPRNLRNIDHIFTSSHPARCTTCGLLLAPTRSPTQGEVRDRQIGEAGRNLLFLQSWEGTQEQGQQLSSPQKKSLHLKCRLYATMSSSVNSIGKYLVETTFSVETWKSIKEPYLLVFRKTYSTSGGLSI